MEVSFDIKDPVELTTISHVITKFRQSFSWIWRRIRKNYHDIG